MLSIIKKFLWKIVKKLVHLLAGKVKKLARLLAHWPAKLKNRHAKLKNWHRFGTFIGTFAYWHVKMRSWHAFGTFACGHVDHAST